MFFAINYCLTCHHEPTMNYVTVQILSTPSTFYNPERLKPSKSLDKEYTKNFYTAIVPMSFSASGKLNSISLLHNNLSGCSANAY